MYVLNEKLTDLDQIKKCPEMGNFAIYSILENLNLKVLYYSNIFFTNLDIGHKPRKESDF